MTERKYSLTKIVPGDYVFPSNDATRLLRVHRYFEDGSLREEVSPGVYRTVRGHFWAAQRWDGPLEQAIEEAQVMEIDEWQDDRRWNTCDCLLRTREDAIRAAMSTT